MAIPIVALALLAALPRGVATWALDDGQLARLDVDPCACLFQGALLPSEIYNDYPTNDSGKYANLSGIARYGASCAVHDMVADSPWKGYCPNDASFGDTDWNWCQQPWCYVNGSCSTAVASSVFAGSPVAFYSYDACAAPDCYTNIAWSVSDWTGSSIPSGCPYDPNGESTYTIFKQDDCACLYHGSSLASDIYMNYPSSDPGKYQDLTAIEVYGTTCSAWDQLPDTPWYSYCPNTSDFCHQDYNWCQEPWCYVRENCSTAVASTVFSGSPVAFYSYDTCASAPDCYTDIAWAEDNWDNTSIVPAECPFETDDSDQTLQGWYTYQYVCPDGFTGSVGSDEASARAGAGTAVLVVLLAMVK